MRLGAATVALALAAALAGCTAAQPAPTTSASASAGDHVPQPSTTVRGSEVSATPAGDPTCEKIIPQTTVQTFADTGWSSREELFYVGNVELPGGIQCTWGDPKVPSDQVQLFGWAPATPELIAAAKKELLDAGAGWTEFDEGGATYITAGKDMIMNPDDQGYGMTYRFDKDQITVADTKQGLLLVEWPPTG
ncbi:hypothetical protein GCM10022240_13590 [Microbacterium kribbense]|uniref:Nitrate ABC transporter substrate-binding protein n=1 Tax=Microbacterium kribbense TaxID=433645 RepID=A0ABP7GEQ3_9MICO